MAEVVKDPPAPPAETKPVGDQPPAPSAPDPKAVQDGKAGDGAAGSKPGESPAKADPPAPTAPEKYELKVPENSLVDASDLELVERIARENQLPNEQAQELVAMRHAEMQEANAADLTVLKAHKVYGGDKLAETQQLANAILDKVAKVTGPELSAELRHILGRSGGNKLAVMSFLAEVGRMTKEDGPVEGSAGGSEDRSKIPLAKRLYPNTPEKYDPAPAKS